MKKLRWLLLVILSVALAFCFAACSGKSIITMTDSSGNEVEINYNDIEAITVLNESEVADPGFELSSFRWSNIAIHITFLDEATPAADVFLSEDMIKAESKLKIGRPGTYSINAIFAGKVDFSFTLTLYVLTEKTYRIAFYDENGESIIGEPMYKKEGVRIVPPVLPTKEGYTHVGWSKKGETALVTDFTVREDVNYVAVYQSDFCTVGFYSRVGEKTELIATASVPRGGNALDYAPEIPTIAGYSEGKWEDETTMTSVMSDCDFYAVYQTDAVMVTFSYYKYVGGTYYDYPVSGAMALETEGITPPADVERTDEYVFLYWYVERNGQEKRVSFPYKVVGEIKFIAKYASYADGSDDLTYRFDDSEGAYVMTGVKEGTNPDVVVIPEMHLGMPVNAVEDGAFRNVSVKKFVVSPTHRYFRVYDGALYNAQMTDLYAYPTGSERADFETVPSLVTIRPYAFYGAENLVSLSLYSRITDIGESAFENCYALASLELPEKVTEISARLLKNAKSLQSFSMSSDVVSIEDEAFYGDASLRELQLPYGLQTIGKLVFFGCRELSSVTMSAPVTNVVRNFTVSNGALYGYNYERTNEYYYLYLYPSKYAGASRASEYWLHSGVRVIKSGAFSYSAVVGLYVPSTSVSFERESVVSPIIRSLRFIGGSTVTFADEAFGAANPEVLYLFDSTVVNNDLGIQRIIYTESTSPYREFSNDFAYELITIESRTRARIIAYRGSDKDIVIPSTLGAGEVSEIADGVFAGYSSIVSVTFPDSLTKIGVEAFEGCTSLQTVRFGTGLRELGDYAFDNCGKNVRFYADNTVLSDVGENAFGSIDDSLYADENGIVSIAGVVVGMLGYRKSVVIPAGTTVIAQEAFKNTNYISTVSFDRAANTLCRIKRGAFEGCEELTSISFPTATTNDGQRLLEEIGENAFADCVRLRSIQNRPSMGVADSAFIGVGTVLTDCWGADGHTMIAYYGTSDTVVVPDTFTSIGKNAFAGNGDIRMVVLGKTIKEIEENAFAYCVHLNRIVIGDALAEIGEKAFYGCSDLIDIEIGNKAPLKKIAYDAFDGTAWLNEYIDDSVIINGIYFKYIGAAEELHILNSVTKINDRAFYQAQTLDSVRFPDSLQVIGNDAFAYSRVSKIDFGQNAKKVTEIGDRAFIGCDNLMYLDLRALTGLVSIGTEAFYGIKAIAGGTLNLRFGASLSEIGDKAFARSDVSTVIFSTGSKLQRIGTMVFEGCELLQSVVFEGKSNLREIGESAFEGCVSLRVFGNANGKLEIIGDKAFKGDTLLDNFNVNEEYLKNVGKDAFEGNSFVTQNDDTMVFIGTVLVKYNGKLSETVKIPVKTTVIGNGAFAGNTYIKNIIFETENGQCSLKEIQSSAFEGCSALVAVSLPSSLEIIRDSAFFGCTSLRSITLSSVRSIGVKAFGNCSALTSVTLPATLIAFGADTDEDRLIGGGVFVGCSSLTEISAEAGGAYVSEDGILYCVSMHASEGEGGDASIIEYPSAKVVGVYDLPETLTVGNATYTVVAIGQYAFAEIPASSLSAINVNQNVTSVGKWAFAGTTAYVSFAPSIHILELGAYAFADYQGTEIILPDGIESFGDRAFENVDNVTSIAVPRSVTQIGAYVFSGTDVDVVWDVESELTEIGAYAFVGYEGNAIVIPSSVVSIGEYAFRDVTSELAIYAELQTIGSYAFYGYKGTNLVIPESVTEIRDHAYAEVTQTSGLKIPAGTIAIGEYAFKNVNSVTFADGAQLDEIGAYAFAGFGGATIALPVSVVKLREYAFYDAHLTLIVQNGALTEIGAYAFSKTKLRSFSVHVATQSIGEGAFAECGQLTSVAFAEGNSVQLLGRGLFADCDALTEVTLPFVGRTKDTELYLGYLFGAYAYSQNSIYVPSSLSAVRVLGGYATEEEKYYSTIVSNMFYGCNRLQALFVEDASVAVRENALVGCTGLRELAITFGGVLGTLFGAERYNDNVTVVPESLAIVRFIGVKTISDYAMYACMNVQNIYLPDGLLSIGKYAFFNCSRLATFSIGREVSYIGENAFGRCSSMRAFQVDTDNAFFVSAEGVLYEKNDENDTAKLIAYPLKKNGTSYTVELIVDGTEYTITEIGGYVFHSSVLTEINIPNTVRTIGEFAFYYSKVESLLVSTGEIGQNAFRGCKDMKTVYLADDSIARQSTDAKGIFENVEYVYVPVSYYAVMGSNAYVSNHYVLLTIGNTGAGVPIVNDGVKYYVFYKENGTGIVVAPLPVDSEHGQVQVDGENYSVGLRYPTGTEVTLSAVPSEGFAFVGWFGASGLLSASDSYVFTVGSSNVTIKAEYYYIGNEYEYGEWLVDKQQTFGSADEFTAYLLKSTRHDDSILVVDGDGVLNEDLSAFASEATAIRLNTGITGIAANTFSSFKKVTSVAIGSSITTIGASAFAGCTMLASFTGGEGLTTIGAYAFDACTALNEVPVMRSLTTIGEKAFRNTALRSFMIPVTLHFADIGTESFAGATRLKTFSVDKGHTELVAFDGVVYRVLSVSERRASIALCPVGKTGEYEVLPSFVYQTSIYSVVTIDKRAFANCASLSSVVLPDSITALKEFAFAHCSAEIVWTEGVSLEVITERAFSLYDGHELTIPDSVTAIQSAAFANCVRLTDISIPASVAELSDDAFEGCYKLVHVRVLSSVSITTPAALYGEVVRGQEEYETSLNIDETGVQTFIADGTTYLMGYVGSSARLNLYEYDSIDAIYPYAFSGSDFITYISIPSGTKTICSSAFADCKKLAGVTIGTGVVSIASNAFTNSPISSASIPVTAIPYIPKDKLSVLILFADGAETTVADKAYENCLSLTSVSFREGITAIGARAFYECTALSSVALGESVLSIQSYAFYGCDSLITVELPEELEEVNSYAFASCDSLVSITVPDSVTVLGEGLFDGCTGLYSVLLPDTVTTLSDYLFRNCETLWDVTLPTDLEEIGISTFENCSSMTSISIGQSVRSVGDNAFAGCVSVESISIGNVLETIGENAFYGCLGITMVTLPASVTSIGSTAFADTGVSTVTVLASGISVGDDVFGGCEVIMATVPAELIDSVSGEALTSLSVNGGQRIEATGLDDCVSLTALELPASVNYIRDNAFVSAPIAQASVPAFAIPYIKSANLTELVVISGTVIVASAARECTLLRSVSFHDGIEEIGAYAFADCISLAIASLPSSLTMIGEGAFMNDADLQRVDLPVGLVSLGANAFKGCSEIEEVSVPNGIVVIPASVFEGCTSLNSVTVGSDLQDVEEKAFFGCVALSTVYNYSDLSFEKGATTYGYISYYADSIVQASYVTIGEYRYKVNDNSYVLVEYTGTSDEIVLPETADGQEYTIRMRTTPSQVTIPSGYGTVNANAFASCDTLVFVVLEDGLTTVGESAFKDCKNLLKVTIGSNVDQIANDAFYGCIKLKEVYNRSSLPIAAHDDQNGYVAYYASNVYTPDSGSSTVQTNGDYVWMSNILIAYVGDETVITLPSSGTYTIGNYAFASSCITSVTIPGGVIVIGTSAFEGCSSLESVTIGNDVISIGQNAWKGCSALQEVHIGLSVETIQSGTFDGCDALTNIEVEDGNGFFAVVDDVLYAYGEGIATVVVNYGGQEIPAVVTIGGDDYTVSE